MVCLGFSGISNVQFQVYVRMMLCFCCHLSFDSYMHFDLFVSGVYEMIHRHGKAIRYRKPTLIYK